MSDLFKIKRAEVLQVPSVQDFKSKETRIARIFETYFAGSETQKNSYQKKYPKTTTMIDNNQKIIQKSLQTLTLLDNEKIREESKKECSPSSAIGNPLCGIHFSGDQTKGLNLHFVNLIMNEYFNYRLFIDYYTHRLQQVINNTSTDSIQTRMMYISEMNSLLQQRDLFEHSIKQSLKELQEVAMSYPLHVGLVRYQEVLLEFRDKYLAKLITPFYTLYEKLRNVQIPQS
jgi:hypothetical protein